MSDDARDWSTVLACDIEEGDIVAGLGCVRRAQEDIGPADESLPSMHGAGLTVTYHPTWTVTLTGDGDNQRTYRANEPVLAIVRADPSSPTAPLS